ncbi:hypothetical protein U732_102 [Clostridium argentinense CDC 2741]|uniref:Uncharacterized protein n=2 Tax=Clostridium argentinense TaxID=29341 RepID=A0A0C1TX00_9CLOT|nr:hypothetical protein [Clostridium argentinense]ARC83163.1 hypothetical protein RSJ17_00500 [Clostridium argentinense]KIE45214.1 hypothetical protein U732_102 [Clostridium argentinense CDC 2741]NFF41406.1 hypothetical protein [Clostridium argentinense]NFP52070.1 hypothetical protein [Clostridium argentinense]NFP74434.1 hypothetical protein [Clostridium argentinense]
MGKIKINKNKYNSITIRLKEDLINELDIVIENIGEILGDEVSRNSILEQMIIDAKNSCIFELNGKEYTFDEILKYKNVKEIEDNNMIMKKGIENGEIE